MLDFVERKKPDNDPEFMPYENDITALLHDKALANLSIAYPRMDDILAGKRVDNLSRLEMALGYMQEPCSDVQNGEVNIAYSVHVNDAINKGSDISGWGKAINYAMSKETVNNGIVQASSYFTNKFFNNSVISKVQKAAAIAVERGESARAVYDVVRSSIDKHYGSVRYWKLVANSSASRAFHYGLVKGGSLMGYTTVKFSAILDNRTSDICRNLDGTTWDIHHVVDIMERANTGNIDDWKSAMPWISASAYDELSEQEMEQAGVMIPPRHGNCRSVLEIM